MKQHFTLLLVVVALGACKQDAGISPVAPETEAAAAAVPAAQRPTGAAFGTPLPQNVVLSQPHNVTMDIEQESRSGVMGRRVEFEYLDGDASQAMAEFAEAMSVAGFATIDGPNNENGVVRQVFKKAGYGSVFARSQAQDVTRRKHEKALGFVVVAWPEGEGKLQVEPGQAQ